jgi:hypothetical protein
LDLVLAPNVETAAATVLPANHAPVYRKRVLVGGVPPTLGRSEEGSDFLTSNLLTKATLESLCTRDWPLQFAL